MADDKTIVDVVAPDLTQVMSTEVAVTGDPRGEQRDPRGRRGKGVPQPPATAPPSHPAYNVSPGSVNDAANEILAGTQGAVDTYEQLKTTVNSTKAWVFWAPNDNPTIPVYDSGSETPKNGPQGPPTGYAPANDPNPAMTAQLGAVEDNLLLEIADSITLAGQFVDQLNNAMQFYAKADKSSVLPVPAGYGTMDQAPNPGGGGTGMPANEPKGGGTPPK